MGGKILILGGYGNFGKRIAEQLSARGRSVILGGRNPIRASELAAKLGPLAEPAHVDAARIEEALELLTPRVLVHTAGPFQGQSYEVARAAIRAGVHYVDLSDGRHFVAGISTLDREARERGVTIISGASTVPALSSAVIDHYRGEFSRMTRLHYGISPGQRAERGLATTAGVLSYAGRPLALHAGGARRYGWQDIYRHSFPEMGKRWMANCDIPDLDLFAKRYAIENIHFSAGLELVSLHLGLWGLGWLVRLFPSLRPERLAPHLLRASNWFDRFGSDTGGMFVRLEGEGPGGQPHQREWHIIARAGDGPYIPTIPAVLLAAQLAVGEARLPAGAMPAMGLVTLEEYIAALDNKAISVYEDRIQQVQK